MSDNESIPDLIQAILKMDILGVIKNILEDVIKESGISGKNQFYALYSHIIKHDRPPKRDLGFIDRLLIEGYETTDITGLSTLIMKLIISESSPHYQIHQTNMRDDVLHLTNIRNKLFHTNVLTISEFRKHINDLGTLAVHFQHYLNESTKSYKHDVEAIQTKAFCAIDHEKKRNTIKDGFLDMGLHLYKIVETDSHYTLVPCTKSSCDNFEGENNQPKVEKESSNSQMAYTCTIPNCNESIYLKNEELIEGIDDNDIALKPMIRHETNPVDPSQRKDIDRLKEIQEVSRRRKTDFEEKGHKRRSGTSQSSGKYGETSITRRPEAQHSEYSPTVVENLCTRYADKTFEKPKKVMTQCNTEWNLRNKNQVAKQFGSENRNEGQTSKDILDVLTFEDPSFTNTTLMDKVREYLSTRVCGFKMHHIHEFSRPGLWQLTTWTNNNYLIYAFPIEKNGELQIQDIMTFMYHSKLQNQTLQNASDRNNITPALVISEMPVNRLNRFIPTINTKDKPYDMVFLYCLGDRDKAIEYLELTKQMVMPNINPLKLELFESVQNPGQKELSNFSDLSIQSHIFAVVLTQKMVRSYINLHKIQMLLRKLFAEERNPLKHMICIEENNCRIPAILAPLEHVLEEDLRMKQPEVKEKLVKILKHHIS